MKQSTFPQQELFRIALAWLLPVAICWLQWMLWSSIEPYAWFFFFPVIFLAPLIGGTWGGLGATLISTLLVWYFFLAPPLSFAIADLRDLFPTATFVAIGAGFSLILKRLRFSERKYRDLYDNSPDMYMSGYPADHIIRECNLTLARTLGYTREELIGKSNQILFEPASYANMVATLPKYMAAKQYPNFEVRLRRKDGSVLDALMSGALEPDPAGGPALSRVTLHDISERKRLENDLRHSEQKFAAFFRSSPIAVNVSLRTDGRFLDVNEAFVSQFGYTREELIGRTSVEIGLFTAETRSRALQQLREADKLSDNSIAITCKSGEVKQCELAVETVDLPDGPCLIISAVDITEHRELQRLLQQANAELEQQVAARTADLQETVAELKRANAGKDAFLGVVSYELRSPLAAILSMSELLESDTYGPLAPAQARPVAAIRQSGQRLLGTVNNVLLYTDLMTGATPVRSGPCHLAGLCATAVRSVRPDAERKQQRIIQTVEPPDLQIESDSLGIMQVLKTLLGNAVKFTPDAGSIELTVRELPDADAVQIVVADNGIGMREEQVAVLFRPFSQGDQSFARPFAGLGLGLA